MTSASSDISSQQAPSSPVSPSSPLSEPSDAEILSLARLQGLNTAAPFDQDILRGYRGLRAMTMRIDRRWAWADEPAFGFDPEAQK